MTTGDKIYIYSTIYIFELFYFGILSLILEYLSRHTQKKVLRTSEKVTDEKKLNEKNNHCNRRTRTCNHLNWIAIKLMQADIVATRIFSNTAILSTTSLYHFVRPIKIIFQKCLLSIIDTEAVIV